MEKENKKIPPQDDLEKANLDELRLGGLDKALEESDEETYVKESLIDDFKNGLAEVKAEVDKDDKVKSIEIKTGGKTVYFEDRAGIRKLEEQKNLRGEGVLHGKRDKLDIVDLEKFDPALLSPTRNEKENRGN